MLLLNNSPLTIHTVRVSTTYIFTYRCIIVWTVLEGSSDDLREGLLVANDLVEDPEQGDPVAVVVAEETCEEGSTQGVLHSKGVLLIPQLEVGTCHRQGEGRGRDQCSHQNFEIGGCRGESKALVSNPAPILCECHYCAIDCCVLACV